MSWYGAAVEKIGDGLLVHRVEGTRVWASRGYRLFHSLDGGRSWKGQGSPVPGGWRSYTGRPRPLGRITRAGISSVLPLEDGGTLCAVPGGILLREAGSPGYRRVFRIPGGSRPLGICSTADGELYWGEYFLNLRRTRPVRIFRSRDGGRSWETAYTFPRGSVCHVHRVLDDPYDGSLLVCTGDRDEEVGIWQSRDGFATLTRVAGGGQLYRTTCPIPRPSCILYGTDWPSGPNSIMALDRATGRVEGLQAVPGPVLCGCEVGEMVVFSTMVERQGHELTLWLGNEAGFRLLAHLKARKWHRLWRELAGYPRVVLPEGRAAWPVLFATPVGTKYWAERLLRIDVEAAGESRLGGGLP